MLSDKRVADLLNAFASSDPTPGGGSAAALSGALGASLLAMVAGLPKTKNNTAEERAALDAARERLLQLQSTLLSLVDRDADAYDRVVAAYKLPKATDEEKEARKQAVQAALKYATEVPIETFSACGDAIESGRVVAHAGNPSASSDIAVGVQTLMTAISGALMNVQTNLGSVKDDDFVRETVATIRRRLEGSSTAMHDIMSSPAFVELHKQAAQLLGSAHPHGAEVTPEMRARGAVMVLGQLDAADARRALAALAESENAYMAKAEREALDKID